LDGSLGVGIALADGHWDLGGGGITSAEGLHDWGRRAVPLFNYTLAFALQLRKIMEYLSQCCRVVGDYSLRRLGRLFFFMDSLGWPAEHQSTSVTRGGLQSALGRHKCLPSCRTTGFPDSLAVYIGVTRRGDGPGPF
jgi:hypothetical protein